MTTRFDEPLDQSKVLHRKGPRNSDVPYLPGHEVIATANRMFGYGGWSYTVQSGEWQKTHAVAHVRVQASVDGDLVTRDGYGFVEATPDRQTGEIKMAELEKCIKGAVTDALKFALRTFGPQFGLTLYDDSPDTSGNGSGEGQSGGSGNRGRSQSRNQGGNAEGAVKAVRQQIENIEKALEKGDLDAAESAFKRAKTAMGHVSKDHADYKELVGTLTALDTSLKSKLGE